MMLKKNGKKAAKMRSPENRKTTMSRIQLHRLARLASLLKRNGYHSPADILEEYYSLEHVDGLVPHDRYCIRTVFRDVQILKEEQKKQRLLFKASWMGFQLPCGSE